MIERPRDRADAAARWLVTASANARDEKRMQGAISKVLTQDLVTTRRYIRDLGMVGPLAFDTTQHAALVAEHVVPVMRQLAWRLAVRAWANPRPNHNEPYTVNLTQPVVSSGARIPTSALVAQAPGGQPPEPDAFTVGLEIGFDVALPDEGLERLVQTHVAFLADSWGQELAQQVMSTIADAVADGDSIDNAAMALTDTVGGAARAEVVARTETIGLTNAVQLDELRQTGLATTKTWSATADGRTRDTHEHADGQTVPIDGFFDIGGFQAQYPGDKRLPLKEFIQCRCTLLYDVADEDLNAPTHTPLTAAATEGAAMAKQSRWRKRHVPRKKPRVDDLTIQLARGVVESIRPQSTRLPRPFTFPEAADLGPARTQAELSLVASVVSARRECAKLLRPYVDDLADWLGISRPDEIQVRPSRDALAWIERGDHGARLCFSAEVIEGLPGMEPGTLGHRRLLEDLMAHELLHLGCEDRAALVASASARYDGDAHGSLFRHLAVEISDEFGVQPPKACEDASRWPMSHRPRGFYGIRVDRIPLQ